MSSNDSLTVISALLTLFWAFPFLRMMSSWLEDRTLDGRLAFLALAAHVIVLCTLWRLGNQVLLLCYLVLTTVMTIFIPLINAIGERVSLRRMHDADIARYRQMLEANPRNSAALAGIADIHMAYERYAEAAAYYERAIEADPHTTRKERARLLHAQEQLAKSRRARRPLDIPPELPPASPPPPTDEPAAPPKDIWVGKAPATPPTPPPAPPTPTAHEPNSLELWRAENR